MFLEAVECIREFFKEKTNVFLGAIYFFIAQQTTGWATSVHGTSETGKPEWTIGKKFSGDRIANLLEWMSKCPALLDSMTSSITFDLPNLIIQVL